MKRRPRYLTAHIQSVTIATDTVKAAIPLAGLTTSVTTNITPTGCPCVVPGQAVPPGSDAFTFNPFDENNGYQDD